MNLSRYFVFAIAVLGVATISCSGDVPTKANIQVSQDDLKHSDVSRASALLDSIEKLPPGNRQMVADMPRTAATLKAAADEDAATKQRIDSLGLKFSGAGK